MKNKKSILILSVLVIAALVFSITSCNITDPKQNLAVIFNTISLQTSASVTFVDAANDQQIGSASKKVVNVTFSGKDKSDIVTMRAEPLTSTSTDFGIITFALSDGITPSASNPVKVTLVASSDGYVTTSYPVVITSTGSRSLIVKMIKVDAPPQGTTTSQPTQVSTSGSGTTTTQTQIKTDTTSSSQGSAEITIPSNTTLSDANGNPVTGNVTATVTYSSGTSGSNSGTLPTGLSVGVIDQSGAQSSGYVQPAAVASFTLTNQNGQVVSQLSQPVQLTLAVPGGTINPTTNAAIKNGDEVPIYSFDEDAQAWKFETNSTASGPDAQGNFTLTFQAPHLSSWMAGWIASGAQTCTKSFTLNIHGSYSAITLKVFLGDDESSIFSTDLTSNDTTFSFDNLTVPKNVPIKIKAYGKLICPNPVVGELDIPDLCSASNPLTLNVNSGSDRQDVFVDVTAICKDRDPVLKIKPDGYDIFVTNSCGNDINVGTLHNGTITLKGFLLNQTYTFKVIYKGKAYSDSHIVDQTTYVFDYDLDPDVCADFK